MNSPMFQTSSSSWNLATKQQKLLFLHLLTDLFWHKAFLGSSGGALHLAWSEVVPSGGWHDTVDWVTTLVWRGAFVVDASLLCWKGLDDKLVAFLL